MFDRKSTVIKDGSKLSFDYVPATIVCREKQQRALEMLFHPLVTAGRSCTAFLTGGVGTGKTVTAKRFCADMARYCQQHNGLLDVTDVNCRIRNTEYGVILELLRHYDKGFPDRGFSADEMLLSLKKHIETEQHPTVIILDEADNLLRNNSRNLIYQLTRFSEELKGMSSLSLILISQFSIAEMLDEATMSTFKRANSVRFDRYSEDELRQIVTARAAEALEEGTLTEEGAGMIAGLAAEYGDARFAIEILERAASVAETEEEGVICPDDIRTAGASVYSDISESKLDDLDTNRRLALLSVSRAIRDRPAISITAVERTYAVVCEEYGVPARKHTQFWTYVQGLERNGLLTTEVRSEADGGRVTYIGIPGIPPRELAKKLEYIIDRDGVVGDEHDL
mgnify:CR=1 FL=1